MNTVTCPVCEADVEVADDVVVGEILECEDCSTELEIISIIPLVVAEAPEVEEDWGE